MRAVDEVVQDRRVDIVARDPLVRGGLTGLVESADPQFHVDRALGPEDIEEDHEAASDATLIVWAYAGPEDDGAIAASAVHRRLVVLVDPQDLPASSWSKNVGAVVARTVEPVRLRSVLRAVADNWRVSDPSLSVNALSPQTAPSHSVPQFSARELEVLNLLGGGASNREVAEALAISINTAKFHLRSILNKLGAESRTEAVVLAARQGLIAL